MLSSRGDNCCGSIIGGSGGDAGVQAKEEESRGEIASSLDEEKSREVQGMISRLN